MSVDGLMSTSAYGKVIQDLLARALEAKDSGRIEPALTQDQLGPFVHDIEITREALGESENGQAHHAAIETVVRERFYDILASTAIDEPAFGQMWNLLDIVSMISDNELCEPGLVFWLIEELLDSQTIDGCGIVFDYLESRRERITAKHFKQKNLIILRSCNELLRRLSRAEDTVFCGRVFIFLFQSFPLGDKSSVNLRGEFHTENVTAFDEHPRQSGPVGAMEVDVSNVETDKDKQEIKSEKDANDNSSTGHAASDVDLDKLYPIFWRLQSSFSAPTRLFDSTNLQVFKNGLQATLDSFRKIPVSVGSSIKHGEEASIGQKRKRSPGQAEFASMFNPKYLTSRDLFELEIHDIAFRRHVLVQALIILEFLLSLTPSAKQKLVNLTNKSVLYSFTLPDDEAKWTASTKLAVAEYLQQSTSNGKFYYRMVDTVLSRDKNWVRWKAENCPEIQRAPVSIQQQLTAEASVEKYCQTTDLPRPMGALNFGFLTKDSGLEGLKDTDHFRIPSSESFYQGIMADDLDAEMGTDEEMQLAKERREAKIWKALRASSNRFELCEKIDNNRNLKALAAQSSDVVTSEEITIPAADG
ncbi:putative nuclear matrix protein [Phaeomoniella chlamydospora]|uniref:Putative nuclear matrix protein n=1 Tax=Phaeomoniella chlamydospora TaxID=158046 RepID=A0A0G2E348_PHACM|nr:putative nuclear matrix protein [Phaeomoniella chlamydospora]